MIMSCPQVPHQSQNGADVLLDKLFDQLYNDTIGDCFTSVLLFSLVFGSTPARLSCSCIFKYKHLFILFRTTDLNLLSPQNHITSSSLSLVIEFL